jgi:peroxisomal 3,2-trans-enoyl-CoA isomerase
MDSFAIKNLEKSRDQIIELVDAFINFSKPIFAAVNGPAIGISFSLLALCDVIYCTEHTYFSAPFISLALAPEACSSYLFTRIFGNSLGREIILFGRKIVAEEGMRCGFVSKVLKKEGFRDATLQKAKEFSLFDADNLIAFKKLLNSEKEILNKVNRNEINLLFQQWQKGSFLNQMKKTIEGNAKRTKAKL